MQGKKDKKNGVMKSGSLEGRPSTPPVEKKSSKLAAFGKLFKPWKWKRRKKPSEQIEKTAVDLERQISLRTTREELIKRGVLKEVEEPVQNTEPQLESVDESKNEPNQPNGTAHNSETIYPKSNGTNSGGEVPAQSQAVHIAVVPEPNRTTMTTHADMAPSPRNNNMAVGSGHYSVRSETPVQDETGLWHYGTVPGARHGIFRNSRPNVQGRLSMSQVETPSGEPIKIYHANRSGIEPSQVRVMLPMDASDRKIPVVQRASQIPVSHESSVSSPSPMNQSEISFQQATPLIKTCHTLGDHTPLNFYEEVPAKEPDLTLRPKRSALKGAKKQEELQKQLHKQLQEQMLRHQSGDTPKMPPKVAPKPKSVRLSSSFGGSDKENRPVSGYDDNIPDYDNLQYSDDSDEEIHYRDENSLAKKVARQDSLAKLLNKRPNMNELLSRNILHTRSEQEKQVDREIISSRLTRRLSLRPSLEELEQRNIIHRFDNDELRQKREELKKTLIRKLSFRPTIDELKNKKIIKFSDYVEVTETSLYDRRADKPWTRLTPRDKAAIRKELNEFKGTEMAVHDDSRHLTRFHRP